MAPLRTRLLAAAALLVAIAACGGRGFGRQYEYEEQLYLRPDGSAAVVLNASVPALIALRGLALDPGPRARIDRGEVREMVSEPGLEIARVSRPWRRNGRQFIQIRAEIDDVTKLGDTKLFKWSTYALTAPPEGMREYRQLVGAPPGAPPPGVGWDGSELVAFKLHVPSRIRSHNVRLLDTDEPGGHERGNILTWEQRLGDRLAGKPVDIQVSMESGSILYRTLWLFGLSFGAAMALLAAIIWMIIRRGRRRRR
ncbi:MAG TPA: hypothetical protein VMN81_06010 [Vicinamibacterales bacterium]|nr:hypothetical protein [Vicinamibacterales bacterium]